MVNDKEAKLFETIISKSSIIKGKLPACSLQMELFCEEPILLVIPCGEEGLDGTGEMRVVWVPIFFISVDLAAAAAISIISCTC